MSEVVICSCGKDVGSLIDLYDYLFKIIKEDYKSSKLPNVEVDRITWDPKWNVQMEELLNALHVNRMCCRVELLAKQKIRDLQ